MSSTAPKEPSAAGVASKPSSDAAGTATATAKAIVLPKQGVARVQSVLSGDTVVLLGRPKGPNQPPPVVLFTFSSVMAPVCVLMLVAVAVTVRCGARVGVWSPSLSLSLSLSLSHTHTCFDCQWHFLFRCLLLVLLSRLLLLLVLVFDRFYDLLDGMISGWRARVLRPMNPVPFRLVNGFGNWWWANRSAFKP